MKSGKRIGLSLSGGGYRAAAFHLGTLKKLNELGILNDIDIISSISGGSIIGAFYCCCDKSFVMFEQEMYNALNRKSVIKYILRSSTFFIAVGIFFFFLALCILLSKYITAWLLIPIIPLYIYAIVKYQFLIFPVSKEIEKAYNIFFFKNASLSDLKDKPELAIGATNLQSFRPFTFSKRKMEDSSYAFMNPPVKFKNQKFPIARAVAASSCVPNFFTPIKISIEFFNNPKDFKKVSPVLVDGGIYDNQGIQKLTQPKSSYECDIIITSDAGNKLPFEGFYNNTFILLMRTVETFMARIKNFQMVQNLYNSNSKNKEIAYFSLGWDLENCISGFIKNLKDGNISSNIILAHQIPEVYLQNIDIYKNEITMLLEKNTNYKTIFSNVLTPEKMGIARKIKTNLTTLSELEINTLVTHASNLTELQTKLYCPTLFVN